MTTIKGRPITLAIPVAYYFALGLLTVLVIAFEVGLVTFALVAATIRGGTGFTPLVALAVIGVVVLVPSFFAYMALTIAWRAWMRRPYSLGSARVLGWVTLAFSGLAVLPLLRGGLQGIGALPVFALSILALVCCYARQTAQAWGGEPVA